MVDREYNDSASSSLGPGFKGPALFPPGQLHRPSAWYSSALARNHEVWPEGPGGILDPPEVDIPADWGKIGQLLFPAHP